MHEVHRHLVMTLANIFNGVRAKHCGVDQAALAQIRCRARCQSPLRNTNSARVATRCALDQRVYPPLMSRGKTWTSRSSLDAWTDSARSAEIGTHLL